MSDYVIGIDPGLTGAIALLQDGKLVEVFDMPTSGRGVGGKQRLNSSALSDLLRPFPGVPAYMELVGAMPKQGLSSTFQFGRGCGVVEGALAALQLPMTEVTPQRWKRHFDLVGKDKDAARTRASQLFPTASLARKRDIGRADALLIALYGWRQLKTGG